MHLYEEKTWEQTHIEEQGMRATSPVIRLHPNDDVVIARQQLISGMRVPDEKLVVSGLIPAGHKIASRRVLAGQPVHRYNQIIGMATQDIEPGHHVHVHNLKTKRW